MFKMNKKGFTLVEMLVVIAIIAILVAILVPTVLGATKKAKAATDAANLRSELAEFEIALLTEGVEFSNATASSKTVSGFTDKANGVWYKQVTTASKVDSYTYIFIKKVGEDITAGYAKDSSGNNFTTIAQYAATAEGK